MIEDSHCYFRPVQHSYVSNISRMKQYGGSNPEVFPNCIRSMLPTELAAPFLAFFQLSHFPIINDP